MVVPADGSPLITIWAVMSRSPVAAAFSSLPTIPTVTVPAGNWIGPWPALALANRIASRSEQVPVPDMAQPPACTVSVVSLTTIVAAWAGAGGGQTPLRSASTTTIDTSRDARMTADL